MTGITAEHELSFLLEPRLPEVVIFDFLARDSAIIELSHRIEVERTKARIRFEGDELSDYASRCIENGERAQEVGQFKDANRFFATAQDSIAKARDVYVLLKHSSTYAEAEKKWAIACNDPDGQPILTREKKDELLQALRDREKGDIWTERNWIVRQGMDQPIKYCLGTIRIGVSYASVNRGTTWGHSPKGLHPDGDDTLLISQRMQKQLNQALEDQKADIEFKALAICALDELKDARAALLEAAKRDREQGEVKGEEAMTRVDEPPEAVVKEWQDLDEEALGRVAVTDEVKELHEAARKGDVRQLRYLLEECDQQHFIAVNMRYKEYRAVKHEPVWVDGLDQESRSPLFLSAKFNMAEAGLYLLEMGADPSRRDLNKVTALYSPYLVLTAMLPSVQRPQQCRR